MPPLGHGLGREFCLDCAMDSVGWFLVDDILDKANRHIFAYYRRARSSMQVPEMARIASDGTEDITRMRWQFSVMIKKHVRFGTTLWECIAKVFGVRAVVGHTAAPFLEDDRLQVSAADVPNDTFAFIAHKF